MKTKRVSLTAFASGLIVVCACASAWADGAWEKITTKDGVLYEQREMSGSKYYEYRATLTVPASSDAAMKAIWDQAVSPSTNANLKREFLRRTDDEILVYDQVSHPVVTDREVTLLVKKTRAPLGLKFEAHNELAPPSDGKRIALPRVYGSWTIEAVSPNESRLTYVCYSEPGGSIAAFLVRGPQSKQVMRDVARVKARLGL